MGQLDNLQVFLAVARQGSLAGAAAELNVNHTTIYRRLRRYEQDIGCKLFDRDESGHSLTPNGMDMLETAERIEREMEDLMRRLGDKNSDDQGVLKVTTTHSIAEHLLLPIINEFEQHYPQIVIDLHCSQQHLLIEKREADIAIRPTISPPPHLIGRKLIADNWKLCCSKEYFEKHGAPESVSDFKNHRFIFSDDVLGDYSTMKCLHDIVPTSSIAMICNSLSIIQQAISTGLGIGQIPDWICESDIENFHTIEVDLALAEGEIWLLFHPEMRECAHLRTFTDFVMQRLGKMQPLMSVVG